MQEINYLCGTIKLTLLNKYKQHTVLKFYEVLGVRFLLYGSECWILTKQQLQETEYCEMRFKRSVAGYRRIHKMRNADICQELNIFSLGEKTKECHVSTSNLLKNRLIELIGSLMTAILKEEERERERERERSTTEHIEGSVRLTQRLEQVKQPYPCSS
jgi:hypothetical protein